MSLVWDRHFSNGIRELGYDVQTGRLVVVVPGGERKYYAPVTYDQYAAISRSTFPERVFHDTIEGRVPRIEVAGYDQV